MGGVSCQEVLILAVRHVKRFDLLDPIENCAWNQLRVCRYVSLAPNEKIQKSLAWSVMVHVIDKEIQECRR